MVSVGNKIPILIAGATGQLGAAITKHALEDSRLQVNILVRDPKKNPELTTQVEAAGGKVHKGDLEQPETLKDVTRGIHTVISVITGTDDKVTVDGQIALIQDSIKNGVKRFVPSDFGVDYTNISNEELLASFITDYKAKLDDYLKTNPIPLLRFYTGSIAETMFYILSNGNTYWGDDIRHNITSYDNTARVVVAAVARPELTGRVTYSGSNHTVKEVQDIYNRVRGTTVELKQAGSLEDLKKLTAAKKSEGDHQTAGFLALLSVIYDQRSKFPKTDNDKFPEVKATSLEEFLKENPNVKL